MPESARAAPILVWFRRDLRCTDHPALAAAAASGAPVIPLVVYDPQAAGLGGASRWWLAGSLAALATALQALGSPLVLRQGAVAEVLPGLIAATGARAVYWNTVPEPAGAAEDQALAALVRAAGAEPRRFASGLLFEPDAIRSATGQPYRVFTPFWRACLAAPAPARPLAAPLRLIAPALAPASEPLESWGLLPTAPDWAGGLRDSWSPGEAGAQQRLAAFLDQGLAGYPDQRDRPDRPATSLLSPHLHWGELSPRQLWQAVRTAASASGSGGVERAAEAYLRQLGWREFCHGLLAQAPDLAVRPLERRFDAFPWRHDPAALTAWQRGRTGWPLVDAGMRQLWHTGWMHNRVRMLAASVLVKHLLLPWQAGLAWFNDTLVDADLANNAAGWQWVAGCGADAAPYVRIFNPILQAQRFDPEGRYIRRWVPELARLGAPWCHRPWQAPPLVLAEAGVRLGVTYPLPLIDHDQGRRRALDAYQQIRAAPDPDPLPPELRP